MRPPPLRSRICTRDLSSDRRRGASAFVAGVLALAIGGSPIASASGPPPADAEAPTWSPQDEAVEPKPAESTAPAEPAPAEPTPPAEPAPPAEPKPAGPTAPSDTTKAPPTTADGKSVGEASSRPAAKDATVLEGAPDRMRPMQKAGWWTLFGGFVFATVGGVFSGLAERQEDKADRIAVRFDENSAQPNYEDVQDEYETILGRGRAFANTAIALGVVGGALAIAGITLLAVDEARVRKREKREDKRARIDLRGGLRVRF
jgi:hypothetical protein